MYYTDVFVGLVKDNIEKLKKALKAVVPSFDDNSDDLTQLVHGLCLFMGYPSCLCSLKANVDKSLKDISEKLKKDSEAVKSSHSIPKLDLNCSCNSKEILCKCCVISCIKELRGKSQCDCIKKPSQSCQCKGTKEKCCKDFLSGLEACLSLLNLKTDLAVCNCKAPDCCNNGTCIKSCNVCPNSKTLKTPKDYTVTGLGLLRPSPIRLAERLEKFFGSTGRKGNPPCKCQCGTSNKSCCCLACQNCSSKNSCFCGSTSKCSCAQAPKDCPRQKFCSKIKDIKIPADSTDMQCCKGGQKCHCELAGSGSSNCSGQCCVVTANGNPPAYYQSLKCLIRRLVKFFNGLSLDPSQPKSSCLCCELLCVLKISYFLKDLFNDSKKWAGKKSCGKCNGKGTGKCTQGTGKGSKCCNGTISACKSGDCCQGCPECNAIKFSRALKALRFAGPCGQELYRLLKDLLNFCSNVMAPNQDFIHSTVVQAVKGCLKCGKSGTDSSDWKACECSSGPSSCQACPKLLKDSKLMSILRHGYVSSYTYKFESVIDPPAKSTYASWNSLCASGSKCCSNPSCSQCSPSGCSSSGSSCPSQCCPDCPQRKAAKIFLGMLPCLYYGLKILRDRCKYNSGFTGWHDISVNSDDSPKNDLAKFFFAWGYDLRPLKSKKGSEFFPLLDSLFNGSFKSLYDVSKNYIISLSSPSRSPSISSSHLKPSPPSTVRQMLLWLYGLRFHKHFSDLVSHCKSLCLPFGNSFHPDAFCYYIHASCFLLPVAIISLIEDSLSITSLHSEFSKFFYPSDPSDLFEKLCEYARKIFVA
ncbi:hypothetical protein X943_003379, partial [Babesia divergens]